MNRREVVAGSLLLMLILAFAFPAYADVGIPMLALMWAPGPSPRVARGLPTARWATRSLRDQDALYSIQDS